MRRVVCRRVLSGIIFTAFLGLMAQGAEAEQVTFPDKPPPESFYVDEVGLIAQTEVEAINGLAGSLLREQQIPIVVVTIPSLAAHNAENYSVERYGWELFNHWGIGSERRSYGMLLLVSSRERRARIVMGAAWKHSHNHQAQEVIDALILPLFKEGKFSQGIVAGVRGMDAMARGLKLPGPKLSWSVIKEKWEGGGWMVTVLGVAFFLRLFRSTSLAQGGPYHRDHYDRGSSSQGSSGSGSSGSGSSTGGGASGSW